MIHSQRYEFKVPSHHETIELQNFKSITDEPKNADIGFFEEVVVSKEFQHQGNPDPRNIRNEVISSMTSIFHCVRI